MECISDFLGDKPYMMGDRVTIIQYSQGMQIFLEYQGPCVGPNIGLNGSNKKAKLSFQPETGLS